MSTWRRCGASVRKVPRKPISRSSSPRNAESPLATSTLLPGYLATELPGFHEYFDANYVQLPLEKGDAVFFNPALFHGAGTNRTANVKRMANLLQVSSAFGRALGAVNRATVSAAVFPELLRRKNSGATERELHNIIAASAEGYPFPTNLDRDQPVGSLNPESQAQLLWRALQGNWDQAELVAELRAQDERRVPDQPGPVIAPPVVAAGRAG
jgi:hypothetical protein